MFHKKSYAWGAIFLALGPLATAPRASAPCAQDNAGLTLPKGFCAQVVADGIGKARHLTVAPNGDIFVALRPAEHSPGGVLALRDTTGDGVADVRARFAEGSGDDVAFYGDYLYYSTNDTVMRYPWRTGALKPSGPAEIVVSGLPAAHGHRAKSIAFGPDGALYVNIGSPSNACQKEDRTPGVPGQDPCEELKTRAGIWRFDANRLNQRQEDGSRFATGLRNTVALAVHPQNGQLYGVVHGRDQLNLWRSFGTEENAEKPSEELVRLRRGDDFGWPYCYHDPKLGKKVLAPEYGGDGKTVGRCRDAQPPLMAFPAHWAPNGLHFYSGKQFPDPYKGGAFIAFHGSWNRAHLPQQGYNVVFAPFQGDEPAKSWQVFADGFAGEHLTPDDAAHRPVGIAEGPDGSLYISDDQGGRIYRILYTKENR